MVMLHHKCHRHNKKNVYDMGIRQGIFYMIHSPNKTIVLCGMVLGTHPASRHAVNM